MADIRFAAQLIGKRIAYCQAMIIVLNRAVVK